MQATIVSGCLDHLRLEEGMAWCLERPEDAVLAEGLDLLLQLCRVGDPNIGLLLAATEKAHGAYHLWCLAFADACVL